MTVLSIVPGPCDPEDLIDGIIFAASYLGSTHLLSERTPTKSARMQQAQEAMSRVRVSHTGVTSVIILMSLVPYNYVYYIVRYISLLNSY